MRCLSLLLAFALLPTILPAQDAPEAEAEKKADSISLARGRVSLPVPGNWERKQPRSRIVEHEFAAKGPKDAKDAKPARVTIMGAGGGIDANIRRWEGQFRNAEGGAAKAKVQKSKVGKNEVYIVDISGVYLDRPGGPFAGGKVTPRKGYRMLGAIIVAEDDGKPLGQYFVKVLGQEKTVAENLKPLKDMLSDLEVK